MSFIAQHNVNAVRTDNSARRTPNASFLDTVLSIAIFRCWHLVLFFGLWSTFVVLLDMESEEINFRIPDALLLIVGSALGFITTFRANSSFERWNEGRAIWAQVLLIARTFGRSVWFQVNDKMPDQAMSQEEMIARSLVEKKTALNLIEAYAVALKHYLRGEDGIYYTDLYHLVKFLPAYTLPAGIVNEDAPRHIQDDEQTLNGDADSINEKQPAAYLPNERTPITPRFSNIPITPIPRDYRTISEKESHDILSTGDEIFLVPGYKPPTTVNMIFDFWPVNKVMASYKAKKNAKAATNGKKAAKMRAKLMNANTSQNLPLQILMYLHSYVAVLASRKTQENQTITSLNQSVTQLTDALTNLERIVSTPLPWSYRIHFWVVLIGWNLLFPFQVVDKMGWFTIPGALIFASIFFGFLVAGEEIENPFGYDKNDLNMDHYTQTIIRQELIAITSSPAPDPSQWIFTPFNDLALSGAQCDSNSVKGPSGGRYGYKDVQRVSPEEWIRRGAGDMMGCLQEVKG